MAWWNESTEKGGLVPEGTYTALLKDAKLDTTRTPQKLSLIFKIIDPGTDYDGDTLFVNLTFSEKAAKFVRWQLDVLNCYECMKSEETEAAAINSAADAVFALTGKTTCTVQVSHREYNGKTYTDTVIKEVLPDTSHQTSLNFDHDELFA